MNNKKFLIIQTAFLGDVILTLPIVQELKRKYPESEIDFLCIPETSELLKNNPHISEIISYDKKNSGVIGFRDLINKLRSKNYDILISPHRSFRSSLISKLSNAKKTISYDKSSLNFLFDKKIKYRKELHEILRDLALLEPIGIKSNKIVKPELYISVQDKRKIDSLFYEHRVKDNEKFITIAPGSVWFTKRFPEEKFAKLCDLMFNMNTKIFLIGGKKDKVFSDFIQNNSKNRNIINVTGNFSIMESAELIKRSEVLITNDSAPLHIANAVETNVVAIFGATVPAFGFYPIGKKDIVIETNGLSCRPCAIHGGKKCPVGTFVCMKNIDEQNIMIAVKKLLS